MKILLFNGSPRNGNTMIALKALREKLEEVPDAEIQEIKAEGKNIIPCRGCNACMNMSRCIFADDSPEINEAVENADAIVFATPVYFWGMTAQMKLVVDKFFARMEKFRGTKKVGTIVIGGQATEHVQYQLVQQQFDCMCDYFKWDHVFQKSIAAYKPADLKENQEALEEIRGLADLLV